MEKYPWVRPRKGYGTVVGSPLFHPSSCQCIPAKISVDKFQTDIKVATVHHTASYSTTHWTMYLPNVPNTKPPMMKGSSNSIDDEDSNIG